MQFVLPQFGPGSTVTVKVVVLVLPQASKAVTCTGVLEFTGKQEVLGGLNFRMAPLVGQQLSTAVTLNTTGVQGLQVYTVMSGALIEMQFVGAQFGPGLTVTVK